MLKSSDIDLVYLVKEEENNEELRYSLRSLVNLPYRKVFIVGYKPSWVKNVNYIAIKQQADRKYDNIQRMFLEVCSNPGISDDFILMNDDFYAINKINRLPVMRRRLPIEHYIKIHKDKGFTSHYLRTMIEAADFLHNIGIKEVDSYEAHVPMVINKNKFLELYGKYPIANSPHRKTIYGNYYHLGGERIDNAKVVKDGAKFSTKNIFLSTTDAVFEGSEVGHFIVSRFSKKCKYER